MHSWKRDQGNHKEIESKKSAEKVDRTPDLMIFSHTLSQLSYLGFCQWFHVAPDDNESSQLWILLNQSFIKMQAIHRLAPSVIKYSTRLYKPARIFGRAL